MGERGARQTAGLQALLPVVCIWLGEACWFEHWDEAVQYEEYNYVAMQLLNTNLSENRKLMPDLKYPVRIFEMCVDEWAGG